MGGHQRSGGRKSFSFFGFSSSTWRKEWSGTGIMEPGRENGRETGLRFQPDRG